METIENLCLKMNASLQLPRGKKKERNTLKVFKCVYFPELIKTSTAILCLYGYLSKKFAYFYYQHRDAIKATLYSTHGCAFLILL